MNTSDSRKLVVEPQVRGGGNAGVAASGASFRAAANGRQRDAAFSSAMLNDENFAYLAERTRHHSDLADARLEALGEALAAEEAETVEKIAKTLTDACTRLGAVQMMRLSIALQMLSRRGLLLEARNIFAELKTEYARFKETLICI